MSNAPFPPWDPDGRLQRAHQRRLAEMDIAAGIAAKKIAERLPYWHLVRMAGVSGFPMTDSLNYFFHEYFNRIVQHGTDSLPTSANIGQDFLVFNKEYYVLDKRDEREHLLSSDEYFSWYVENDMPKDPSVLKTVMEEGVVYSYNMTLDQSTHRLHTSDSELAIIGVSLVRHRNYLSCLLLSGENPPVPSDKEVKKDLKAGYDVLPGKEWLRSEEAYEVADRYLKVLPGFSRINLLARFNLLESKYESRYLGRDIGPGFRTATDDPRELESISEAWPDSAEGYVKNVQETLERYSELFSALTSFIYLPVMFINELNRVTETKFATDLLTRQHDEDIKSAIQIFGEDARRYYRTVKCLQSQSGVAASEEQISPPEMEFETDGYWKKLAANAIGTDREGNPIVGKTWVERRDAWFACKPTTFLIKRQKERIDGPDPGVVYILSSPAHGADVYKVGFTRRSAEQRANEISSSTGVPLPFGVVANWEVSNCAEIEKTVHRKLDWCRLSSRREFFYTKLPIIVEVVQQAIANA